MTGWTGADLSELLAFTIDSKKSLNKAVVLDGDAKADADADAAADVAVTVAVDVNGAAHCQDVI